MKNKLSAHEITSYAIYVALFLFIGLTPYIGYISIPPVKATLMAIPVGIVSIHKKIKGAIFGCFMFGLTSIFAALIYGSVFLNYPYGWGYAFLFLFVGRLLILIPLVPLIWILDNKLSSKFSSIKSLACTLLIAISNTLIVILLVYLVGSGNIGLVSGGSGYWSFIALIGKNIAVEWTIPPVIALAIGETINKISSREKQVKSAKW